MDRYDASGDLADLRQARDLYAEAFEAAQDDYYTGINAATTSVLLGSPEELDKGVAYARRVQEIVGTDKHPNDYWKTATVAEALLIQRDFAKAAKVYDAAVAWRRRRSPRTRPLGSKLRVCWKSSHRVPRSALWRKNHLST
jgi:hypothetical protein